MNNSAAGYDELPSSIIKQCVETYVKQLTFLINMSITQGTFPNELKKNARVIPLYKGEDTQLIYQFYIISLKYLRKLCLHMQLNFLEENNIIYEYLFGF